MAIENFNEVIEYITANSETNEEVSNYIKGFNKIDFNGAKSFLETNEEGKSYFDARVGKAIENYKTNTVPKLIDAELLKRNPALTPEQIETQNLKAELENYKSEKVKSEMTIKYKDILNEKKIPSSLTNFLLGENEDLTIANITLFEEAMQSYIANGVQEKLNQGSHVPPVLGGRVLSDVDKLTAKEKLALAYSTKK